MRNIAHIRTETGDIQTLEDHLNGTAELCEQFAGELGVTYVGRVLGLLHDLGKASQDFNDYIMGIGDHSRGEIDHSTAGAQYLREHVDSKDASHIFALEMMELSIVSHHSGLINCISSDGTPAFVNRICKNVTKTYYEEACNRIDSSILGEVDILLTKAVDELAILVKKICETSSDAKRAGFRLSLLNRMMASCRDFDTFLF